MALLSVGEVVIGAWPRVAVADRMKSLGTQRRDGGVRGRAGRHDKSGKVSVLLSEHFRSRRLHHFTRTGVATRAASVVTESSGAFGSRRCCGWRDDAETESSVDI